MNQALLACCFVTSIFLRVCIKNRKMKNPSRLLSFLFLSFMAIGNSICPNILVPRFELVSPLPYQPKGLSSYDDKAIIMK